MSKENTGLLGKVMLAAVLLIFGAVVVGVIADTSYSKTITQTYTDTVDISPLRTADGGLNYTLAESNKLYSTAILSHPAGGNWRQDYSDCAIPTVLYYNQTGALMSNSADYTWVEDGNGAAGWLRLKNVVNLNTSASNLTTITYNSCPEGYVASSWGRNVLNMLGGFFALLLFGAAVGVMYSIYKEVTD